MLTSNISKKLANSKTLLVSEDCLGRIASIASERHESNRSFFFQRAFLYLIFGVVGRGGGVLSLIKTNVVMKMSASFD